MSNTAHPMRPGVHQGKPARGFTLIELMITVAVMGIILGIAIPAYQQYVNKSRRTIAKTALLDFASREEKYYSINNAYTAEIGTGGLGYNTATNFTGTAPTEVMGLTGSGTTVYYNLSFSVAPATTTTPPNSSYTVQAVPVNQQANDSCGTFTVNNLGQQTAALTSGCW